MPLALDTECYPNFHLICIGNKEWHTSTNYTKDQRKEIASIMQKERTYGFNSLSYDIPIICAAITGLSVEALHEISRAIISEGLPYWTTYDKFSIKKIAFKHFDIKEPAPAVMISLKMYGARMNMKRLQDLPYDPTLPLREHEKREVINYCFNDIATTQALYNAIKSRLSLRMSLSKEYGVNLTSKSDAQIAEAIIKYYVGKVKKSSSPPSIRYTFPDFIKRSPAISDVYTFINGRAFQLKNKKITLPTNMPTVKIGDMVYKFGVGGLHSTEKNQTIIPTANQILADRDVASYYPAIILALKLYPEGIGSKFLEAYQSIFDKRIEAKERAKTGDKKAEVIRDGFKIVLNGSYGKFGSHYSFLYSPQLLLQTTLTGQLALLQLIEVLHNAGIKTVSANTDGIVSLLDKSDYQTYDALCQQWETDTGFTLEETQYRSLHSRDVNTFIAITTEGKIKGKGDYAPPSLMKSPRCPILSVAVKQYLLNGTPIEDTIRDCSDITQFISVRNVKGGAQDGLGKVVRWYYSIHGEPIYYASNGNKVATTDGAMPVMDLPDTLPDDIDYEKYISDAHKMKELLC